MPYSDIATRECLETASDFAAREACIGTSADLCMATPEGGTTYGMNGCLDRELAFWDKVLNQNYQIRMADAKARDADVGPTLGVQADALRDMQLAWIAFRDAACEFERSQWQGGTGGGPATIACMLELTGRQALVLGRVDR
nr:lysozyme inhibitor LprI family protein [Sulfitobacter aestuariivivens]